MREFAHPAKRERQAADINQALETTLTIARSEYRLVADLETDYGALPPVWCHVSELNQAFLNVIVNAAHAIADGRADGAKPRGKLRVSTRCDGEHVEMRIADDGNGIPLHVRDRIFDPFFTTKAVGRGTGQGLAIAHGVVVNKHGGTIHFESEIGVGTTFILRLPVGAPAPASASPPRQPHRCPPDARRSIA